MPAQPSHPSHSLVEAFSEIARHVHSSEDPEDSLQRITTTAVDALEGCDSASLSLLAKNGPVTRAATDQLSRDGDQIQYDEGEGPCLDAAMEERWLYCPNIAADRRWPRSAARMAAELGVGSMVSCRLTLDASPNHTLGGLNIYSMRKDAFSDEDQMLAILLSSLGAVVADASYQQSHLRAAIESRTVIGEAIGILRSQSGLTRDQAFKVLSQASQRMNLKLRDLAQRIADGEMASEIPGSSPVTEP
jgi:transcriptional regulator with GAF, ATPase, and Fis domain